MSTYLYKLWMARLWLCLSAVVAALGYHFGNVRFAPIAAGFAILALLSYGSHLRHFGAARPAIERR